MIGSLGLFFLLVFGHWEVEQRELNSSPGTKCSIVKEVIQDQAASTFLPFILSLS
jgi:hypothetical protein